MNRHPATQETKLVDSTPKRQFPSDQGLERHYAAERRRQAKLRKRDAAVQAVIVAARRAAGGRGPGSYHYQVSLDDLLDLRAALKALDAVQGRA